MIVPGISATAGAVIAGKTNIPDNVDKNFYWKLFE